MQKTRQSNKRGTKWETVCRVSPQPTATAAIRYRSDQATDEPLSIDTDIILTCACGHTNLASNIEIYKEKDHHYIYCEACNKDHRIDIETQIIFTVRVKQITDRTKE